eukprot:scaffold124827_cov63-Phaeocystis_antarctica.AAC.2
MARCACWRTASPGALRVRLRDPVPSAVRLGRAEGLCVEPGRRAGRGRVCMVADVVAPRLRLTFDLLYHRIRRFIITAP